MAVQPLIIKIDKGMIRTVQLKHPMTTLQTSTPYRLAAFLVNGLRWSRRAFESPSPHYVKQACLLRNGDPSAVWIETGTYKGQTTELLARKASMVYSLEPAKVLYDRAVLRFMGYRNVELINGPSEDVLPMLLPQVTGTVSFWLDGHYSAGMTFQGTNETPIVTELESISQHLHRWNKVAVMVDDVRCFAPERKEFAGYPPLDFLVDWARQNKLTWHIEHDIFVAKTAL